MRYHEDIETRFTARHKTCIEFSGDVKDRVVLDVGCWIGWYERFMVEKGCNFIVGMDLDRNALREAKKSVSADRCEFVCASAYKFPFKLGGFDVVSMFDVIEHVPAGSELNLLSEVKYVLKIKGMLFLSVPNKAFWSYMLDPAWYFGHRHYSLEQLKLFFQINGFTIEKIKYGGGLFELFGMILLYIFKWGFKREMPLKQWFDKKRDREYLQNKNCFATIFIGGKSE